MCLRQQCYTIDDFQVRLGCLDPLVGRTDCYIAARFLSSKTYLRLQCPIKVIHLMKIIKPRHLKAGARCPV